MLVRRIAVAAVLCLVVTSGLAGCVPAACSGAAAYPPGVWLDVSPWLHAHPDATLRACLDSRCVTSAPGNEVLQLVVPNKTFPPRTVRYTLTVTSANDAELRSSTSVRLDESQVHGPCGTQTWWSADARLSADGAVTVWHGEPGPIVPTAPPPITTTSTPPGRRNTQPLRYHRGAWTWSSCMAPQRRAS